MDRNDREMLSVELTRLHGQDIHHDGAPAEETFEARERLEKRLRRAGREAEQQIPSDEEKPSGR